MQDPREDFGPPGGEGLGDDDGTARPPGLSPHSPPDLVTVKSEPPEDWQSSSCRLPTPKLEDPCEDFLSCAPGYSAPASPTWPPTIVQPTPLPLPTTSAARGKPSRGRRRGQFKLRFHHQALPQEYLDHYEATQTLQTSKAPEKVPDVINNGVAVNNNESVRSWLQRIASLQQDSSVAPDVAEITENQNEADKKRRTPRVVNYSDLPYMGEMTLDNSKPRRGRKPKKADICHLIYKNYGTIFPGTPQNLMDEERKNTRVNSKPTSTNTSKKTDVQHKIISSLLEKRLTQESRALQLPMLAEPLNLCVRDSHPRLPYPIPSSSDEEVEIIPDILSVSSTPRVTSPETDQMLANNLKMSLPIFDPALLARKLESPDTPSSTNSDPASYVYWPGANVFMHPMALYYQKLAAAAAASSGAVTSPIANNIIVPPRETQRLLVPKQISQLIDPAKTSQSPKPAKASSPTKRKRSAIFIPPMPTENNNPATEVSICKFKFTGGAKPSLQEKKSLSVDSGGNFRYYSGTGDKSMRGYEFFPRESLQQPGNRTGTSNSGAFLKASGERCLPSPVTPPETPIVVTTPQNHVLDRQNETVCRKRKSRRSLQREKLEQTFKEKGFLIQTQQLESAEGATYCKFRQLRKFTRYLFRSWKDYLPGDLQGAPGSLIDTPAPQNAILPPPIEGTSNSL